MSANRSIIVKAILILALVWGGVFAVRTFAAGKKVTAERLDREVRELNLADWSETQGGATEAKRREEEIRRIGDMLNKLDFQEREKNRDSRTGLGFFEKLSPQEKNLFIDITIVESMSRFMQAIDQMPPEQRKEFVEKGLKDIREGRTEEEMRDAKELDETLLSKISQQGMSAYFDKASAETKMDLAPLMEAMNDVMQGLSGNQFGPQ